MAENINKDRAKEILKDRRPKSHYETYQSEITGYMASKLEKYNVPIHTIMEIAQYCFTATMLVANDEVRREYRRWAKKDRKGVDNGR